MLRALSLVISLEIAAPEPSEPAPEPAELTLDDAKLMVARDLHVRGEQAFRAGDYPGAIEAWSQVLILMPDKQADLRIPLAHAHRQAYDSDQDIGHLRAARRLFGEHLDSLVADDPVRGDIEAEIAQIDVELAARAASEAQAQAARDEAIRQDQIRRDQAALAVAEARHQHNLQKVYFGVGGSLTGVGIVLLGVMTGSLVTGNRLEREGRAMATKVGVPDGYYAQQLAKGQAQNRIAVASAVVGGMLTAAGITLFGIAAARRKQIRAHANIVMFEGGQLRF